MEEKRGKTMSVVNFPARLKVTHYCLCSDARFGNTWQAWTVCGIDEALSEPDFFMSLAGAGIQAGDAIELFEVSDTTMPERDQIALGVVRVTQVDAGKHVHFIRAGETLRFIGFPEKGISSGEWGGKFWVYRDGKRLKSYKTRLEASEAAREMGEQAA
jgi:hypothetical protein